MVKAASIYTCQNCGAKFSKWKGQCSECGAWNTVIEEATTVEGIATQLLTTQNLYDDARVVELQELAGDAGSVPRISTDIGELDRVLGGGLVPGSVILIGGDPGIGKSTILLQTLAKLANNNISTVYISGEESINQVRMRAKRLKVDLAPIKIASANSTTDIVKTLEDKQYQDLKVVVIDSIQTMFLPQISAAPGTVSQVRTSANELISLAKRKDICMLIVSHVTKDGQISGPKILEHMVDAVLYFEGEKNQQFRILRSIKNRFGATNEIGVFEMNEGGLIEVNNPSELFLSSRRENISGSCVFAGIEGSRPLLIEVQALLNNSFIPVPRRAVIGWDANRLAMILAVLSARMGIRTYDKEVYLNVVGGIKIDEPALDLAVACSIISALKDIPIPQDMVIFGEVGLSGEIRITNNMEARIMEAKKLGFKQIILPAGIKKLRHLSWDKFADLSLICISHLRELGVLFKPKHTADPHPTAIDADNSPST